MTTVTDSGGARWNFWIDRGGTFTDVVARREDGRLTSLKLLSENPGAYEDAAVEGIRRILNAPKDGPLPAHLIASVRMGTTVATNALLERKGAPLVFVTTAGFKDQLAIAYQDRPHIFALNIERPEQLYERVIEVEERVSAEGEVLRVPDTETVRDALEEAHADGLRAAAVCFLHGYRYHEHERRVAAVAREVGFEQVSVSHEVSPLMKFVGRGDTTVVDAYLSPILRRYVDQVAGALDLDASGGRLYFMQSNGGLTQADLFQGKDAILSGPAGGVVGMARVSEMAGYDRVIGFDMGGTSTDVSHYNGTFERTFDSRTAGVRVRAPMMVIHTVAAGGGSILHFDGQRLRAGPDSAGADPGPACYRKGGPLTVTDANVMTGKLDPAFFPAIFGPGADEPLDAEAVQRGFDDLCERIGDGRSPEDVADGFIAVAVENMAQAIKKISVARGHDVTRYTLTCFGGAAAQHACMVADRLGIATILIHPLSGVLSAYGMGLADITAEREEAVECPLDQQHMAGIRDALSRLEAETRAELAAQDVPHQDQQAHGSVLVRYEGTDTALAVEAGGAQDMAQEFEAAHRQRFGFAQSDKKLIAEAVSVQAVGSGLTVQETPSAEEPPEAEPQPSRQTRIYSLGLWHDAPIFRRTSLKPGHRIPGPAIVTEEHATIVIEDGWQAEITPLDHVRLKRQGGPPLHRRAGAEADPVMLEIFNNLFMSSAEQMGAVLENTATSVNIRERLDFSCAVFDREGNLVANAPHIPVHLGSMSDSVRSIIAANRDDLNPGDVFALNAPYNGGTHLPDITVTAPVFDRQEKEIIFYVAARGHHADVGGLTPGSMPALSQTIQHEGVLIDNFRLVHRGRFEEQRLRNLLASDPYPARNPDQNVADLKAQIAACERGIGELRKMVDEFGLDVVH
ncbi:MAG: hydantoinase/oxoprolinase family protein, partial [Alphaproteobacteria bacterium]